MEKINRWKTRAQRQIETESAMSFKSAILLLGFNRIDYFSQVLASLEKNQTSYEHDLHVYFDCGPDARQAESERLCTHSNTCRFYLY